MGDEGLNIEATSGEGLNDEKLIGVVGGCSSRSCGWM